MFHLMVELACLVMFLCCSKRGLERLLHQDSWHGQWQLVLCRVYYIGVWNRFPFCGDVDDFTFVGFESHMSVILPGLETEVGVSHQGNGWCDTECNHRRRVEPLIGLWSVDR